MSDEAKTNRARSLASADVGSGKLARGAGAGAGRRGLLVVVVGALELLADGLDLLGAGVGDGGSVAVVGVDAGQDVAAGGRDAVDDDVTLVHGVAVAAAAVQLAKVLDQEVGDADGTSAVVLDDYDSSQFDCECLEVVCVDSPLSSAPLAPPPMTYAVPEASWVLMVRASSQTATHQTFLMVQEPRDS